MNGPVRIARRTREGGTHAAPRHDQRVNLLGAVDAAVADEFQRQKALASELDQLMNAHRAAGAAPAPPVRSSPRSADPPPPEWLNPVTSRPKHVNFAWCYRFLWTTPHETRAQLVPLRNRESRSQYIRIGKLLSAEWGRELDRRARRRSRFSGGSPPLRASRVRQDRYMRVLRGEPRRTSSRPAGRTSSCDRGRRRRCRGGCGGRSGGCAFLQRRTCAIQGSVECASPPPRPPCHRSTRRRWLPRNPVACGKAAPLRNTAVVDILEAVLREAMGADFQLQRVASRPPELDSTTGSCLPRPAPCPRRRRTQSLRRQRESLSPAATRRASASPGRHRLVLSRAEGIVFEGGRPGAARRRTRTPRRPRRRPGPRRSRPATGARSRWASTWPATGSPSRRWRWASTWPARRRRRVGGGQLLPRRCNGRPARAPHSSGVGGTAPLHLRRTFGAGGREKPQRAGTEPGRSRARTGSNLTGSRTGTRPEEGPPMWRVDFARSLVPYLQRVRRRWPERGRKKAGMEPGREPAPGGFCGGPGSRPSSIWRARTRGPARRASPRRARRSPGREHEDVATTRPAVSCKAANTNTRLPRSP